MTREIFCKIYDMLMDNDSYKTKYTTILLKSGKMILTDLSKCELLDGFVRIAEKNNLYSFSHNFVPYKNIEMISCDTEEQEENS